MRGEAGPEQCFQLRLIDLETLRLFEDESGEMA